MRFADKREDFVRSVETVALLLSVGAVFLQIWVLISALEAYFKGDYEHLGYSVILSALALAACSVSVFLTKLPFLKGMTEGRGKTYQKHV